MIASIVWDVDPILFKVGSWEVRWYGLMWGLGFILAYEMVSRLFKKEKYPEEWVDKLFVYCIVSTVIGARLGHCLFYEWDYYGAHPVEIFKIWKGGLASPRRGVRHHSGSDVVLEKSNPEKCVVVV